MINNAVLDVAIGLIFIYLLYSLLASTIKELIATLFAYRSRMMERGIEQMLDGENYSYYWWDKLWHNLATLLSKKSWQNIYNGFNNAEGILAKMSYCTRWLFSKKHIAKKLHRKASENCSPNIASIKMKQTKLCKKRSLFASCVTAHPLYRRSAQDNVFSRKPAYLTSDTFSDILIDILSNNESPVLLKSIRDNVMDKFNAHPKMNSETRKIINLYIDQANGDLVRFKLLVEKWFDDTMDRVSGWYKKQAFRILLIIGFILAMMFNVSTIEIVQKLSADKTTREAIVKSASDYIKAHQNDIAANKITPAQGNKKVEIQLSDSIKKDFFDKKTAIQHNINLLKKSIGSAKTSTADKNQAVKQIGELINQIKLIDIKLSPNNSKTDTSNTPFVTGVTNIKKLYTDSIQEQNTTLGLGWGDYGFTADSAQWVKKVKAVCKTNASSTNKNMALNPLKPKKPSIWGKFWYIVWQTLSSPKKWIGFLITSLAISMGASFWFDLLNKFINLRAAGPKPDDKDTTASKTATLNQKPGINSFA